MDSDKQTKQFYDEKIDFHMMSHLRVKEGHTLKSINHKWLTEFVNIMF